MAVGQLGTITRGQESFRLPNLVSPSEQLIPSSHTLEITNSEQLGNSSGGRKARRLEVIFVRKEAVIKSKQDGLPGR